MDQFSIVRRRRWSRFAAGMLLAATSLGAVALFAPHALAQAGGAATGATAQATPGEALEAVEGRWEGFVRVAVVIALFVVPIWLGGVLSKRLRMPEHGWKFAIAIGVIAAAAVVVLTGNVKYGPDLKGGIILIYELADESAQPADAAPGNKDNQRADDDAARIGADDTGMSSDDLVASLISVLRERIDPAGTKEVSIRKYGEGQIEIIIPYAEKQELEYIERRVSTAGQLVFRITASRKFSSHQAVIDIATERTPPGQDIIKLGGKEVARWVELDDEEFPTLDEANRRGLVTRTSGKVHQALVMTDDGLDVTGRYLKAVSPDVDETGRPQVSFAFNSAGAFLFGQLTGQHVPTSTGLEYNLGILLDNRLMSAPTIQSKITDRGRISGNMSEEEVNFIVGILKAGPLPASLNKTPISRAQISPTLGAQTIEKGKWALAISLVLVAIFMVWYYRTAGVIACFGLAINMLLIVGAMVLIKAAFTLPGLAGLVLTVGMSVDANVLIYERIREELKRGAALRMAIRNGFDRATTTIIDSNVTNLITGIVIYKIAPDNVKGFGITLVLGIAMSIFVAVFLTRIVFDVLERRGWIKTLRMRQFVGETNFDFLGWQRVCIGASLAVIAVGLIAAAARRGDLFDIDFTGGSSVQLVLREDQAMDFDEVLAVLNETSLADKNLTLVEVGAAERNYTVTTVDDNVTEVEGILAKAFAGKLQTYQVEVSDVAAIPASAAAAEPNAQWRPPRRLWPGLPWPASTMALLQAAPGDSPRDDGDAPAADGDATADVAATDATPMDDASDQEASDAEAAAAGGTGDASERGSNPGEPDPFAGGTSGRVHFRGGAAVDEGDLQTGGVSYDTMQELVADALSRAGHEGVAFLISNPEYTRGTVRNFSEWDVKIALPTAEAQQVFDGIEQRLDNQPVFPLSNKIGSRVASRMATDAIAAIVLCLAGIIGYVWFRFHGVTYGVAAVVALIHDVLVALGFVALSAYLVNWFEPLANVLMIDKFQVSLTLVAAFLTIIGYSLNDTIVIFDRIREVKSKSQRLTAEMINAAVNQCFARTLLTSFTSLISVTVLYIAGGEGIHAFAFALLVGFIAGVYSTIFIANPVLLWLTHRVEGTARSAGGSKAA